MMLKAKIEVRSKFQLRSPLVLDCLNDYRKQLQQGQIHSLELLNSQRL